MIKRALFISAFIIFSMFVAGSILAKVPQPDLFVRGISNVGHWCGTNSTGPTCLVNYSVTIGNLGDGVANSSYTQVTFSKGWINHQDNTFTPAIQPGKTFVFVKTIQLTPGIWNVTAIADSSNLVIESNETNNQKKTIFDIS